VAIADSGLRPVFRCAADGAAAAAAGRARINACAEAAAPIPKNYLVPAFEIFALDFLVNRVGHAFIDPGTYEVSMSSIRRNLSSPWVLDNDPFSINQFMHPYQGSMYHGFARSAGLNYWESVGYTFAGSMLWEIAGETTLPSRNDQIATGIGGSFFGEPLFRLSNLVREKSNRLPPFWREVLAGVISPTTGVTRLAYGDRFRGTFPSRDPAFYARVQFGMTGTSSVHKPDTQSLTRNEAVADFSVDYGLPGKSGYAYHRPFDYFNFQFTTSTGSHFENIFSRGLLAGKAYGGDADRLRGVWGLYGAYDYVAPQIFRLSSTALALGTTLQRRIGESGAIQSTVLAGVGYGAGGAIRTEDETDYHFGLTPQMLAAARFIPGDRVAIDLTFRDYYISRIASTKPGGSENVARADAQFSVRLKGHHAASARYIWTRRAATEPDVGHTIESLGAFGLFYTFLGGARFGTVGFQPGGELHLRRQPVTEAVCRFESVRPTLRHLPPTARRCRAGPRLIARCCKCVCISILRASRGG
jgi:uncharacterized protein DUF3943